MSILKSLRGNLFLKKYRELGGEESEQYLIFLLSSSVSQMAFMDEYEKLEPIETMGKKETLDMYRYVIGLFPDKPNPERKMICKVLYTIGSLL